MACAIQKDYGPLMRPARHGSPTHDRPHSQKHNHNDDNLNPALTLTISNPKYKNTGYVSFMIASICSLSETASSYLGSWGGLELILERTDIR